MTFESERVSDESDRASLLEEKARIAAITAMRKEPKPPADWDKETCYECGVDLPQQRIDAGRFLCVGCKTIEEKKQKGY